MVWWDHSYIKTRPKQQGLPNYVIHPEIRFGSLNHAKRLGYPTASIGICGRKHIPFFFPLEGLESFSTLRWNAFRDPPG